MKPTSRIDIDLRQIRRNAREIARRVKVPVYAVIKADAYGLGSPEVAAALCDVVDGFCFFSLREAMTIGGEIRAAKRVFTIGPPDSLNPADWRRAGVHPAVSSPAQARRLRSADPLLCIDTGMQRFACPAGQIDQALRAGGISEVFTHAITLAHVHRLRQLACGKVKTMHAAASSLLDQPQAWLDAVRPGIALYTNAVRVSAPLVEAQESRGPVGYGGFHATRHGVILCGYSSGLRKGPCLVNGHRRDILEVGMQSAYVEIGPRDRAGDEVVLLGNGLEPGDLAPAWRCSPHEVLLRLARASENRHYVR